MALVYSLAAEKQKKLLVGVAALGFVVLVTLGVFASNGWLPSTDPMGRKTGWFGKELPKNASSSWNPLAAPLPTATPQLSREYVYAGSRLLNVIDSNAQEAPPADIAVWRPSNGNWMVMGQAGSQATTIPWGGGSFGDKPVEGDYDGDGKTDFAVFRPTDDYWYIIPSSTGGPNYMSWGDGGTDTPVPADYDGDGKTDIAVTRPNSGAGILEWYIIKSSDATWYSVSFGANGDIPGPADFDGDGKADQGAYRSSTQHYYSKNSTDGANQFVNIGQTVTCSAPRNCIVPSDYDGDGKADHALYNSASATWHIRQSTNAAVVSTQWGATGDIPVQNDYDGDGKTDLATWHDPTALWTIKRSSNGTTRTETFGQSGDIPVPAFYRR